MRLSGPVVSGLFCISARPNVARSLCPRVLGCTDHRVAPQHRRSVHLSPVFSAKNLLHKFSTKTKKKPWYDSPSFFRPDDKPHGLMSLMKAEQKQKWGNNVRVKILNSILYKALTGLLSTSEVSVTADFSVCRVYWLTSSNKETDAKIETILQKYAHRFRHLLITHQVLGNVPTIVFLKDQEDAKRQEIEDLLATLDFGDHNDSTIKSDDTPRNLDSTSLQPQLSTPSMFGIDHTELNKKIAEYKKGMKVKQTENEAIEFSQQQQEQLAEIKKQKLLKKKLKKEKWVERNPVDPKNYLLALDNDLYTDNQEEYETELEENIEGKEDDGSKLN
ncbi:putative ribosome-binding factor A, mitochondrial isoform X2 [Hyla sarda]|uniref:putative ribosome-binding factor A, mitochondrial isoform X2 n=1 Tax=Hyla sarda TaxID=327740 RepID=UPI0024C2EEBB|nr:putative ribosome-binding factor A, mitochondrial isoform X2 [Hyla sarda]